MPRTTNPTLDDLQHENAVLRNELDEYRQFMDAVRNGDLDALVVAGGEGHRLAPLEQEENTWRRMIEEMGEGAAILTEEGVISYTNRALATMLGMPLRNVIGSDIAHWFGGESLARFRRLFAEELESGQSMVRREEFMLQSVETGTLPVQLTLGVLRKDENIESITVVVVDLSEQKRNEAIAAEERLSRAILEQATDAIVVCDNSGIVIKASAAARKLCNGSPLGRPFVQNYPLQDGNGNPLDIPDLIERVKASRTDAALEHADGTLRIQVGAAPLHGPDDENLGSVITLTNVSELARAEREARTARDDLALELDKSNRSRRALLSVLEDARRTEEALQDSEAHFRLALENLPISVWNMDSELRYSWVYDRELGVEPDAILHKTDADLFDPEDADRLTEIKREVLVTGNACNREVSAIVGGKRCTYTLHIEPKYDAGGRIDGLVGAAFNITEVRELESARRKLSEALFHSATPIALLDAELKFEMANDAFIELFGYDREELAGRPISVISPDEDIATPRHEQILKTVEESNIFRDEVLRRSKSGEIMPFLLTVAPIREDGRLLGLVETYNDLRRYKESELRVRNALTDTISAISMTVEKRDPYTAGHQERVAVLAQAIALEMGLDTARVEGIYLGSLIHDIGKIYIPAEILNRPGKLSEFEFGLIRSHPEVGYEIIKDVKFEWPIADIVHQHHERINGSGYPRGLRGDDILLEAQIVSVADVVEAMTSHRPYRPGLGIDIALAQIEKDAGVLLDTDIVATCVRLFRERGFDWQN